MPAGLRASVPTLPPAADGAPLARALHARTGIGIAAQVVQGRGLAVLRMRVEQPALVFVARGIKTVRAAQTDAVRAPPGQALVLAGQQTVDFHNEITEGAHYEARWLVFDNALLEDTDYRTRAADREARGAAPAPAQLLAQPLQELAHAFESARLGLCNNAVPDAIARLRLLETLHWLLEHGVVLRNPAVRPDVSTRVRALIAGRLADAWPADRVARALAQSQASLRRRLAAEGTSLTQLLTDARMATALTLLQATNRPVTQVALAVGYESPSRFAVRFRHRFGFAPTAVRGHERNP